MIIKCARCGKERPLEAKKMCTPCYVYTRQKRTGYTKRKDVLKKQKEAFKKWYNREGKEKMRKYYWKRRREQGKDIRFNKQTRCLLCDSKMVRKTRKDPDTWIINCDNCKKQTYYLRGVSLP